MVTADQVVRPQFSGRYIEVIAHRGCSGSYPENTLPAFQAAKESGATMIELDVTLTQDRKLIVIHDETLDRTTSGRGEVGSWKFRELRKLDAGSWFDPAFRGVRLPALSQVLRLYCNHSMHVNIEIKPECLDEHLQPDGIEYQVVHEIDRFYLRDRVIVSSFGWKILERISAIDSSLRTALLYEGNLKQIKLKKLSKKYKMFSFNPFWGKLYPDFVRRAHDLGLKVFPYTVNSWQEMAFSLCAGVDGAFTNYPNRFLQAIRDLDTLGGEAGNSTD
ncbi:MAG: glycerophosphodiester phosphodiesterase [Spirochaetales bacterium]|nr:glycerophosphodiester phosphodiesterase [Spirochaetales bacterium]